VLHVERGIVDILCSVKNKQTKKQDNQPINRLSIPMAQVILEQLVVIQLIKKLFLEFRIFIAIFTLYPSPS
jgi:hypothetical protein